MKEILNKIDGYLDIKEKKDAISLSLDEYSNIKDIIEIIKESSDRDKTMSVFSEDMRDKVEKLIEGGIL